MREPATSVSSLAVDAGNVSRVADCVLQVLGAWRRGVCLWVLVVLCATFVQGPEARADDRFEPRLARGRTARSPSRDPIRSLEEFLELLELEDRASRRSSPPEPGAARVVEPSGARTDRPGATRDGQDVAGRFGDDLADRQERAAASARSSWGPLGELVRLDRPSDMYRLPEPREQELELDAVEPTELRIEYLDRPAYVPEGRYEPLLGRGPRESPRSRALKRLMKKEFFRHTRRLLKKHWRKQFKKSVSMSYDDYHDVITQINHIGRSPLEYDNFNTDHYANQARSDVLDEGQEGEREIILVQYGPLQINDEGSVHFDLPRLLGLESKEEKEEELKLSFDPEDEEETSSHGRLRTAALYSGDTVKFRPRLRLKVDPLRSLRGEPMDMLRSYGASLDIDFYSDILHKKLFSLELEGKVRRRGDYAFFVNLVFEARE